MILKATEDLLNCTIDQLLQQAVQAVKKLNHCLWSLGMLLWALEEKGAHRERGFSSMVNYAVSLLGLERQKAYELIRATRVLQAHQALSGAFQSGILGWGKVREITRVVTRDTEQAWLDWAVKHSTEEVQRQVSTSPRAFKAQVLAQKNSGAQKTVQEELPLAAPPPDEPPPGELALPIAVPPAAEPRAPLTASELPATPQAEAPGEEAPAAPGYVLLTFRLSVEEYVRYERASQLLSARRGRRLSRNQVLSQMVEQALTQASDHSRQRYPIVVRVDATTGQGWFETARGPLPATPEQVEESLQTGHVVVFSEALSPDESTPPGAQCPLHAAGPQAKAAPSALAAVAASMAIAIPPAPAAAVAVSAAMAILSAPTAAVAGYSTAAGTAAGPAPETVEAPQATGAQGKLFPVASKPEKAPRRPVSRSLTRVLMARAAGRCEMCGGPGPFHGDHMKPVSQGGINCLKHLRLHCLACHGVRHADDFREGQPWRRARDRAIRRRRQMKARREGRATGGSG